MNDNKFKYYYNLLKGEVGREIIKQCTMCEINKTEVVFSTTYGGYIFICMSCLDKLNGEINKDE